MSVAGRRPADEFVCVGGPFDARGVSRGRFVGAEQWIDGQGRCHASRAPGRWLYRRRGERVVFAGHGARTCMGCGVTVSQGEDGGRLRVCPLCGGEV